MSSVNLENLSQDELNKILKEEYEKNRKLKKERSIKLIRKLRKQNEKLYQVKKKPKPKPKPKSKSKSTSFQNYFQECIKDKVIPEDAPEYFKRALLKAKKEYEKGIILEKSGLYGFAEKYDIKGSSGLIPIEFFREKASIIKDFLRNHRNTKVRMILVCGMETQTIEKIEDSIPIFEHDEAYFHSRTYINLEKTDVKLILKDMIYEMLTNLANYQKKGSGWYFNAIISLEIHTVDYKPMKGGSYNSLPEFIQMINAFFGLFFVIFILF